jgi:hypothetical protein
MFNRDTVFKCNWRGCDVEQPRSLAKNITDLRREI